MYRRETVATQEPWQDDAACKHLHPDFFFSEEPGEQALAKAFCQDCPVRIECLEYAFRKGIEYGVFGGLKDTERRSLLKRRGRAAVTELLERRTVVM